MEGYRASTYGDGFADVYDDWYANVTDVDATVDRLAELAATAGGPVLELGIGTGRLALPLAARGLSVWGIDSSAAMVDALRQKSGGKTIPVAVGDMSELDRDALPGGRDVRFGLVFAAYNTFFNLTSAEAQRRCLGREAGVLGSGGKVLIEAFVPDESAPLSGIEARAVNLDRVVLSVSRREPMDQVVNGQHIEITEAGIRLRPWMIRYATPTQLDVMAADAGLRLEQRWAGWDKSTFDDASAVHISVYGAQ